MSPKISYLCVLFIILVMLLALTSGAVLPHSIPVVAATSATLQDIIQVTASGVHTCALTTSGGIKCWGYNGYGQLGDDTLVNKFTPVDVIGLSTGVTTLSAGGVHTCALTSKGGVKCWGYNGENHDEQPGNGELGDGTTINKSTPVNVSGLVSGVTGLNAGYDHTCALLTTGGAKCWGDNKYAKLGNGTYTPTLTPVDVKGLGSGVTAISTGDYYTCALLTTSGVKCWGFNEYGELGDGTRNYKYVPVDVIGLSSGVTAISSGNYHTCALTTSGGVKCWGSNYYGSLGDNTRDYKLTPVDVSGLSSGVTAISAGAFHTCALTITGGLKCWGLNSAGQLGDGTIENKLAPVDVSELNTGVIAISAGNGHTCALTTTGGVKCWGSNIYGSLGDGTTVNKLTPVDVVDTIPPTATPTNTATNTPTLTPTPVPPTNIPTQTSTSILPTNTPTITPAPTNTPTLPPNLTATAAAIQTAIHEAVGATVTAYAIQTAIAATVTVYATPSSSPPTKTPISDETSTPTPISTPTSITVGLVTPTTTLTPVGTSSTFTLFLPMIVR